MQKSKSIIYINFAQYDNTGRILDYLKRNFKLTVHFSFDHLRLKNGRKSNYLCIYKNNKLVERRKLLSLRTSSLLLFPSLPLVAILILAQTLIYTFRLKKKYGNFDIFFTVNAFSAWIGILAKKAGLCRKTVFWMWDYFPIDHSDWRIKLARWFYWRFDLLSMRWSDKVVFTNHKLMKLQNKAGLLDKKTKKEIVHIGTNLNRFKTYDRNRPIAGFLGMLKTHQGLDLLFDNLDQLLIAMPDIKIEIIGSGPEEERYRKKAEKYKKVIKFYGFIENQDAIQSIIKKWSIGLATYIPLKSNESYWGDPSKIKTYLGLGVPVITTNVSYFTNEIKKYKAGVVIKYHNPNELISAIKTILDSKKTFEKNAFNLARKYNYKSLYPKLFDV